MNYLTELALDWNLVTLGLFLFLSIVVSSLWLMLGQVKAMRRATFMESQLKQAIRDLEGEMGALRARQTKDFSQLEGILSRMELNRMSGSLTSPEPAGRGLDKKHQVVSLARRGLNSEAISRKLKLYKGETELVLGLSKYLASESRTRERSG